MKSKKIFSLVLMCAMIFTSMPITGFADVAGLINPAEKAKMELVLMDYDEGITDDNISLNEGKIHEIAPSQIPASGEFLVAIRIGDLRRIMEGSKGIYSTNVTIRFDPTYLEIEPITTLKGRAQHRVGRNKIYDEDGSYGLVKGAMGIAPSASGSNMSQSVNIMFEFGDALTSPTYKEDEDALIGAIKFKKLNDAPEGTKVLDFEVASGIYASCSFGIAGEDKYTAAGVSDMIPLFTWDVSRVNLFPGKVNLTYHDNVPGGAVIQSGSVEGQTQTVVEGTSVAESVNDGKMLKAPVIPGYVFEGWFTEAAGGTEVTKDTKINEAQDLYAHWAEGYAVTFDPNSGQIDGKDDPKVVKLGKLEKIAKKDVPLNEKLTREDYIFAGWNTKANGTGIMLVDPDAVVG